MLYYCGKMFPLSSICNAAPILFCTRRLGIADPFKEVVEWHTLTEP